MGFAHQSLFIHTYVLIIYNNEAYNEFFYKTAQLTQKRAYITGGNQPIIFEIYTYNILVLNSVNQFANKMSMNSYIVIYSSKSNFWFLMKFPYKIIDALELLIVISHSGIEIDKYASSREQNNPVER